MDEQERLRQQQIFERFDRTFSTDHKGRLRVRNPAQPYALLGLALGLVCTAGVAVAGRGGFVTTGLLQLAVALGLALALLLFVLSRIARGRGQRAAALALGLALSAFLALLVLGVGAGPLDLDLR